MEICERLIKRHRSAAVAMMKPDKLFYVDTTGDPNIFYKKAAEWRDKKYNIKDDIDKAILTTLRRLLSFMSFGNSANAMRNIAISSALGAKKFFVFATNNRKNIAVYNPAANLAELKTLIGRLNEFYKNEFDTSLTLRPAPASFGEELIKRIDEGEKYYIKINGEWTREFLKNLGDEISKISFRDFLKQRLEAWVLWGVPAIYPIRPPAETAKWRKERLANKPPLPELSGCLPAAKNFFHLHTYIFEHYAVPGVVEAAPGDTVIDAGAFNGDTAIYFSRKIGSTGKVFAFEADPLNIANANANLVANACANVKIIPLALSSEQGEIHFAQNQLASSGSRQVTDGGITVKCVDLDSFVAENNIKVNYIKSDIEGGEMKLLEGAREVIKRDGPICGFALYHKREDYHAIPKFLKNLRPDYKFYFRCEAEPVLFATTKM